MKPFTFYITLLFCAYCVQGGVTPKSTINHTTKNELPNVVGLVSTSEKSYHAKTDTKRHADHDGGMIMSKPKLVITFLANSKPVDKMDGFGGGMETPFFLDPFQRLLQFFFSSFARDFSPAYPKEEEIDFTSNNIKEITEKADNISDFDWLTKNEEPKMYCEHGTNGFCRSCHMKARNMLDMEPFRMKREKTTNIAGQHVNISTTDKSKLTQGHSNDHHAITKLNATLTTAANKTSLTTSPPKRVKRDDNVKHARHYFLSISGDTDQRVTAPETSDSINKRAKRGAIQLATNSSDQSFFKILEETIYESLNKDGGILRKDGLNESKEEEITTSAASAATTTDVSNYPNEDDDKEMYNYGITPHVAEYSHGWTYFFLVTLPVSCTFAVVIIFLCIFLRTRGWCCKLFLKDPGITLQEKNAKKQTKRKKPKQIIEA